MIVDIVVDDMTLWHCGDHRNYLNYRLFLACVLGRSVRLPVHMFVTLVIHALNGSRYRSTCRTL